MVLPHPISSFLELFIFFFFDALPLILLFVSIMPIVFTNLRGFTSRRGRLQLVLAEGVGPVLLPGTGHSGCKTLSSVQLYL